MYQDRENEGEFQATRDGGSVSVWKANASMVNPSLSFPNVSIGNPDACGVPDDGLTHAGMTC